MVARARSRRSPLAAAAWGDAWIIVAPRCPLVDKEAKAKAVRRAVTRGCHAPLSRARRGRSGPALGQRCGGAEKGLGGEALVRVFEQRVVSAFDGDDADASVDESAPAVKWVVHLATRPVLGQRGLE